MHKIITVCFLFLSLNVFSQKKYFQQKVNYKIDVSLDDEDHILRAFQKINYTNNSIDTLQFLFFHLWPNAYKNDKTKFTEHIVENGDTKFYYSKKYEKGFIDSLQFKVNDELVNVSEYNNNQDIILIELLHPLLPNQSIEISTPFRVVIPEVFSRMGHKNQAYQISQWYPKPAVFDNKGWHPMPYLDQGEFYSEYGNFEVNISLPKNYVVVATGDLQNKEEEIFLEKRLWKNDSSVLKTFAENPASSNEMKTIQFTQQNVHDFAWFANKQFVTEKTIDTLANGKTTNCFSYFTPKDFKNYENSSVVIAQTLHYLSTHVGEYPYKHASVVAGYLLAGGGMEYPNVTVIGNVDSKKTLQTVIVHEVGHNWFYGLLGSNEREHPWMDEGINSFYENEINHWIHTQKKSTNSNKGLQIEGTKFLYPLTAKQNEDQAIEGLSQDFTKINYGGIVYGKTATMFTYLQQYLGKDLFEKCMKSYYEQWHYKHPYPEDIQAIFEKETNKQLDWFFEDGLNTTKKIDFKIKNVKKENTKTIVSIKNRTNFTGPAPINACIGDSVIETQWIEYPYEQQAIFETENNLINRYVIDAKEWMPEIKLNNNYFYKNSLFHKNAFKPKIGTTLGLNRFQQFFLLPSVAYNFYDKAMLGIIIHNIRIPNNKFQFAFAPMFSFGTKNIVGTGVIGYSIFPKKNIKKIQFAMQGNTFHHNESSLNIKETIYARHIKIAPSVSIDFAQKNLRTPISDNLLLKYYYIANQDFQYNLDLQDSLYKPSISNYVSQQFMNVKYTHKNNRTFNPFSYELNAMGNQYFTKIGFTTNLRIDYHLKNKSFYFRGYVGKFFDFKTISNTYNLQPQYLNATNTSINDYVYDETYVARNEQKGIMSQQISMQEGGMKIKTNLYSNPIGTNNNWLGAINLRTDIPIKLPIVLPIKFQLFLDAATYANAGKQNPSGSKMVYDAGMEIHLLKDLFVIYMPLIMSKDYRDYTKTIYTKNRLLNTMSFSLNLNKINVLKTQDVVNLLGL